MYAKSYIEKTVRSEPSWGTCVELYNITKHKDLGDMMGALASAIRSGSEVTHIDWGEKWINLSIQYLEGMEPLRELANDGKYEQLDKWLEANEDRIISMIHKEYVAVIEQTAQQG